MKVNSTELNSGKRHQHHRDWKHRQAAAMRRGDSKCYIQLKRQHPFVVREYYLFCKGQKGIISIKTGYEKKTEDPECHGSCLTQGT